MGGVRKLVIMPDGETHRPRPRVASPLVKAIAGAHPWQRMLESGECASITELAAAEKIDRSYLCRVLRLTLRRRRSSRRSWTGGRQTGSPCRC
jgi:hypothetical protein